MIVSSYLLYIWEKTIENMLTLNRYCYRLSTLVFTKLSDLSACHSNERKDERDYDNKSFLCYRVTSYFKEIYITSADIFAFIKVKVISMRISSKEIRRNRIRFSFELNFFYYHLYWLYSTSLN